MDWSLLASQCRADPDAYREDFLRQRQRFEALAAVAELEPHAAHPDLSELVWFIGQVAGEYAKEARSVADWAVRYVECAAERMDAQLQSSLVRSVIVFRARGGAAVLPALTTVRWYYRLLRLRNKELRRRVSAAIVAEVRRMAERGGSEWAAMQTQLLQLLGALIPDTDPLAVKRPLRVSFALYRRGVWRDDARLVNTLAEACFHAHPDVVTCACRFLLDADRDAAAAAADTFDESDTETEADEGAATQNKPHAAVRPAIMDTSSTQRLARAFKRTQKKSARNRHRMAQRLARMRRRTATTAATEPPAISSAIQLLHDPQRFVERLLAQLRGRHDPFPLKLTMLNLISRCIGVHQLLFPSFYSFLQRYLRPSQREVTRLLAYAVQACHAQVPPEAVQSLLRHLAYYFVSDRRTEEVMAVGLNAVREICARVPDAMDPVLLQDLTQYQGSRNKGIMMGARGLIRLFRRVDPQRLHPRDRGRPSREEGSGKEEDSASSMGESTPEAREADDFVVPDGACVAYLEPSRPVDPSALEAHSVRHRRSREERLEAVRAGRADRIPYSGNPHRMRPKTGGTSNREKARANPLRMRTAKRKKSEVNRSGRRRATRRR
ncbi:hypothetical protein CDCA_CDCA01G0092 [Cyanidium caldarium]|uniref:Protein SDA1 n=1 Tax=Cyanidium caldarium TaxID=2771 RepID=A0AAV9IP88_CYACA|nr:hypothetical protein CDCA_CDCA01G0092 [Cyanidium caldarium]|eukprot:ctg_883.g410